MLISKTSNQTISDYWPFRHGSLTIVTNNMSGNNFLDFLYQELDDEYSH